MNKILSTGIRWLDHAPELLIRTLVISTAAIVTAWIIVWGWNSVEHMVGNWDRSSPVKVWPVGEAPLVRPGEKATLLVKYEFDHARDACSQIVRRIVIDSKEVSYFITTDSISKEARSEMIDMGFKNETAREVSFIVPINANPGPAMFESRMQFICNKHQKHNPIEYVWSAPFNVVK